MRPFNQKRVTLIELILVLVVLVLITGLVVTLYPNFRAKARIMNTIATIDELDKAIRTYEAIEGKFPDAFDSIIRAGELVTLRPGVSGMLLSVTPLGLVSGSIADILGVTDSDVILALAAVGLEKVFNQDADAPSVTFGFTDTGFNSESIADTTILTTFSDPSTSAPAYGIVPAPAPVVYLVLGIGANVSFVGATPGISSAPLHESYIESENDYGAMYGRYLAIFELKSTLGVMNPVRFIKVASPSAFPGPLGGTIENYKTIYDSF